MKKLLAFGLCLLLAMGLWGCGAAREEEIQPPRETTLPAVTTEATAEPSQTTAATVQPTETAPEDPEEILQAVMENRRQLRMESGSVVYLEEYLAMHQGTEAEQWQFLDMNGDGEREVFAVTDSEEASYVIVHWDGTDPRCFGLSFRSVQVLKENGAMAGANSASGMSLYRVDFQGGALVSTSLAEFDTATEFYTLHGKPATRKEMEAFLKDWNELPEVFGFELSLPEEETYTCAYCRDEVDRLIGELCEDCFEYVAKCDLCGKWSEDTFEGVCSECEPNGGWEGNGGSSGSCMLCGAWCEELLNDMCSDCFWYYDQCDNCGKWVDSIRNGLCDDCWEEGDGSGHCAVCGTWCEVLEGVLCEDCFWCYAQCRLCGKWSDDTFEGICSECEPNGGMG